MDNIYHDSDSCIGVSIIVPIYNTERYLTKCIESVCEQTYSKLEIILVDAGSTDTSSQICDEYTSKDKRIKCIHTTHKNQIEARKIGIVEATMPYIFFSDSDDWIEGDLIEHLMGKIENGTQLVTSGLSYDFYANSFILKDGLASGKYNRNEIRKKVTPEMMYKYSSKGQGIVASMCGKLFERITFKDTLLQVDDRITIGEDGAAVYSYILSIDNLVITDICGYHYVQHDDSTIHTYSYDYFRKIGILEKYLRQHIKVDGKQLRGQIDRYVYSAIEPAVLQMYGIDIKSIYCSHIMLPQLPKGTRIILYGAGERGKKYYINIMRENKCNIVAWVDKNFADIDEAFVESPTVICNRKFDFVFITLKDQDKVDEIIQDLIKQGVAETRIISNV